jgi:hypothetical protein
VTLSDAAIEVVREEAKLQEKNKSQMVEVIVREWAGVPLEESK